MSLLMIIPAYNEELNIERVVDNIIENYPLFDYVVINDGSGDETANICRKKGYRLVDLKCNLGLAGGFQAGMKYAARMNYDYVVQVDADGQHDPKYILPMLKFLQEKKADIVIGSRFVNEQKPNSLRMLGSNLIQLAIKWSSHKNISDPTSGMRLFNRKMIHMFANNINYGPEPDTVAYLVKQGVKVEEFPVQMSERIAGTSYLNFSRSIMYMLRMCISILVIQKFRKKEIM